MNTLRIKAIVRKDLAELHRNSQIIAPLVVVPLLFVVVFPTLIFVLGANEKLTASINGLDQFLENLPEGVVPAGYTVQQTVIYAVTMFFMAPMFLLIPVMVSSILASASIVGEKERRTLEGLLYTPVTNRELVAAKVLGAVLPAVAVGWASFLVYTVIVNALGAQAMGGVFFPNLTWIIMVVVLVPAVAILSTLCVVAVSGKSTTIQGAQGVAGLIVLPIIALVVGQAAGVVLFDVIVVVIASAVVIVADAVLLRVVSGNLSRERLVTQL